MSTLFLKDWYQIDIKIENPVIDLKNIDSVMNNFIKRKLIIKWFFLYEQPEGILTIRVRMKSNNKEGLEEELNKSIKKRDLNVFKNLPFQEYSEGSEMLFNEEVMEKFANIMSETTQLAVKKIKNTQQFDNYRVIERLSHCMFNILAGLSRKSEEEFLKQRFFERTRQDFNSDFENKIK